MPNLLQVSFRLNLREKTIVSVRLLLMEHRVEMQISRTAQVCIDSTSQLPPQSVTTPPLVLTSNEEYLHREDHEFKVPHTDSYVKVLQ